jgi:hypothetical protein
MAAAVAGQSPCAAAAIEVPIKENSAMTATHHGSTPVTASEALERLLDLIDGARGLSSITADDVERVFKVHVSVDGDEFAYGQTLPGNWAFNIERQNVKNQGQRIEFGFSPLPGLDGAPGVICRPSFKQFGARLEEMGFARQKITVEHGRWLLDRFSRGDLSVEVYPIVEVSASADGGTESCVRLVLIR